MQKYLPTLQLKKALLQVEVTKVEKDIKSLESHYNEEKKKVSLYAKLLTHLDAYDLKDYIEIDSIIVVYESIAGIEVPTLQELKFKEVKKAIMYEPFWLDSMVEYLRTLKLAYQKIVIAKEKRDLLVQELRTVSIRVNLFEKRLIPQDEDHIRKIKAFLGDLEIAQIAIGKVTKSIKAKAEEIVA